MIPEMKLAYLSWEAFATLITGISAVGAATYVAMRQQEITERQVKLAELTLRSDLFSHRFDVYEVTRKFLGHIVAHATPPDGNLDQEYLSALGRAQFLFSPPVHENLKDIWSLASRFRAAHIVMKAHRDQHGTYDASQVDAEHEALKSISDVFGNLANMFGEELRLSAAS